MLYAKQSTAITIIVGPILDSAGAEYASAVISDLSISKNGGTLTAMASAATLTLIANGLYTLVFRTSDVDTLGRVQVFCNKVTYQMPSVELMVMPASVYDALITNAAGGANGMVLSLASNQVNVGQWLGTAVSTPTVPGVPNVNAKTWNDLATVALPLIPTTAGRTLDVSVGGEAGLDWANVGSPTTTLALTGTTIASTQKVDVETIKTNPVVNAGTITFPTTATLASTTNITAGTIATVTAVTTVNGLAAGVITAASIAADAITDAKVASDVKIASVTGSVGSVTGLTASNLDATISSRLASASYTAPSNLTAAQIATGVWTDTVASDFTTALSVGKSIMNGVTLGTGLTVAVVSGSVGSVAGNVGGNVTGSVGTVNALAANVITAASIAADADAEIASAVWDVVLSGHLTSGTTGNALNAAGAAGDPWSTALPGAYGSGTAGKIIGDNINATIGSRASQTSLDTVDDYLDTEIAAIKAKTDQFVFTVTNQVDANPSVTGIRAAVGLASANLDTQLAAVKNMVIARP